MDYLIDLFFIMAITIQKGNMASYDHVVLPIENIASLILKTVMNNIWKMSKMRMFWNEKWN